VRGIRGTRGKGGDRLGGRASLRVVVGCGLLMALTPPAAQARPRPEGHPKPPSQAQINAAENQARRAYRCRPPGGLTEASGPEGLSWLSTWP